MSGWISCYNKPEYPFYPEDKSNIFFKNFSFFFPALRQSLYHYFSGKSYKSILLPDYCPEGIYDPFKRLNFQIRFYHIKSNFQIDEESLKSNLVKGIPDVFLNIHHFGIFSKANQDIISKLIDRSTTLVIEDCAHTLPSKIINSNAKISLFSFPKMIGIPMGGSIRFNDENIFEDFSYKTDKYSGELKKRMSSAYIFNRIVNKYKLSDIIAGSFLKLFPNYKFYDYLMLNYDRCFEKLEHHQIEIIKGIDYEKLSTKRKAITENYVNNLSNTYLFNIEKESYLHQPLFNFPVRINDQLKFSKYLYKNGIKGVMLKNRWWFDESKPGELYNHHFLLPNNHNLTVSEQEKIISVVNSY